MQALGWERTRPVAVTVGQRRQTVVDRHRSPVLVTLLGRHLQGKQMSWRCFENDFDFLLLQRSYDLIASGP